MAQQLAEAPKDASALTGSVVGYVQFDETQLPVRFAEVRLVPRPADADLVHVEGRTEISEKPAETSEKPEPHLRMVSGVSEMDGRFHIDGVPAGDYLAGAVMSGYVLPGTAAAVDVATEEQLKQLIASMPMVHVKAGQVASVNLMLHRGAVITGRVRFADGSPAIGSKVGWELVERDLGVESVRMENPSALQQSVREFEYDTQNNRGGATDDEGRYRIFGLRPGKYIVSTVIVSPLGSGQVTMSDGSGSRAGGNRIYPNMTTVYGPGVFRREEAKVFEIRGEEQVTDADLKIDISGVHTIKGRLLAGEDRHVLGQAIIRLKQGGRDLPQLVGIEADGSFEIDYVPSGSYTLGVIGFDNMTVSANVTGAERELPMYQQAKVAVVVGASDVVLDDVVLTALKPGEKMDWP
jgi:hypothetical protein